MASLRDIRRRIRSVRNTAQITKAMELVAASRMRRAQQRVLAARPYATAMNAMIHQLGTTRRQVRSMIRWESVIIAVLGTVLGLVIAVFAGWAMLESVREEGLTEFDPAIATLITIVIVAGLAGVLAAYFPARRASKLDVLESIASS